MIAESLLGTALGAVRPAVITLFLPFGTDAATGRFFRVPFSLAIALCVHPFLSPLPEGGAPLALLLGKEVLLGIVIGLLLARLFILVGAAGAIIDQQAGYTLGNVFDPALGREMGPIETLLSRLLILVTLAGGGSLLLGLLVLRSYELWPLLSFPSWELGYTFLEITLADAVVKMLEATAQLAMPIVTILLFTEAGLAVLGRYAQQLNPFSISLAAKAALLMLVLYSVQHYLLSYLLVLKETWLVLS